MVVDNPLVFLMLPRISYAIPFLPRKLRKLRQATKRFHEYTLDILCNETHLLASEKEGSGTLMTYFVRAMRNGRRSINWPSVTDKPSSHGLSMKEILENSFAINLTSHKTTASTLASAKVMLDSHPER